MKTVSFLSRFTVICNICFVLLVIFGLLEKSGVENAIPGTAEHISFFKELIILLGFFAIFVNLLMCLAYGILWLVRKKVLIPKILAIINVCFLATQIYYYFIF